MNVSTYTKNRSGMHSGCRTACYRTASIHGPEEDREKIATQNYFTRSVLTIWLTYFHRRRGNRDQARMKLPRCRAPGPKGFGNADHDGAPADVPTFLSSHYRPKPTTGPRYQRTDPPFFAFTSASFFPLSRSLAFFCLQTTMIKPSRSTDSCTLSLTIQSSVSYTLLTIFLPFFSTFFLYLSAVLTLVSTCSGHRPRRLGSLSKDGQ